MNSYIIVYGMRNVFVGYIEKIDYKTNTFTTTKDKRKAKNYKGHDNKLADDLVTLRHMGTNFAFDFTTM